MFPYKPNICKIKDENNTVIDLSYSFLLSQVHVYDASQPQIPYYNLKFKMNAQNMCVAMKTFGSEPQMVCDLNGHKNVEKQN